MDNKVVIEVVDELTRNGIDVSVTNYDDNSNNIIELCGEDVVKYITNKTKFFADYHGVTEEQYIDWKEWVDVFGYRKCNKTNKDGKNCGNYIYDIHDVDVKEFKRGYHDMCKLHRS